MSEREAGDAPQRGTVPRTSLRIGIVCPYDWGAHGGVQVHIRDFAAEMTRRGHSVQVLAPADESTALPPYVTSGGRPMNVKFNGSVARLALGPGTTMRVRRWIEAGEFDVLHVHEPHSPSLSGFAVYGAGDVPVVGTFHMAISRSRFISASYRIILPILERLDARIAVSQEARRTIVEHAGGDPVLIPNGIFVEPYASAETRPDWAGSDGTVCFIGRLDEPRKGLDVLLAAWPAVVAAHPGARLLVAGRGDIDAARALLPAPVHDSVQFLGGVTDAEKESMFKTADVYVAPQRGGESFGIVLVEGMAAGAAVVASDLVAFRDVLKEGTLGRLFRNGDPADLAARINELLADRTECARLGAIGARAAWEYDWGTVADRVQEVYELVLTARSMRQALADEGWDDGWSRQR